MIDISELKIGDIIIFRRHYYHPQFTIINGEKESIVSNPNTPQDYALEHYDDHVAMYAGLNEQGTPTILHSVDDCDPAKPDEVYTKKFGLHRTIFRPLDAQVDPDDELQVSYDVEYLVYRSSDEALAKKAYEVLVTQENKLIPYDNDRSNALHTKYQDTETDEMLAITRASYDNAGRYRAIKYAMRPEQWVRTRADGFGKWLICFSVVILAYQLAELYEKKLLQTEHAPIWVSDKYGRLSAEANYSEAFLRYYDSLKRNLDSATDEPDFDASKINSEYRVSADFWNPSEQYPTIESFNSQLPLDSKICTIAALNEYLSSQSLSKNPAWISLGTVKPPIFAPNPEVKSAHKEQQLANRVQQLVDLSEKVDREEALSPSPSKCPTPCLSDNNNSFFNASTSSGSRGVSRRSVSQTQLPFSESRSELGSPSPTNSGQRVDSLVARLKACSTDKANWAAALAERYLHASSSSTPSP